jgi:hypothetical protein
MTSNSTNEPDMTTCDKCAKECEFKTLIHNPNDEWLCEKCDEAVANRQPKEEYDDMGVLCRYTEEDGWYAIEDHCVTCGYRCDECECDDGEEDWIYPCEECDGRPCECKSK